jgi:hypothetical protein
MHKGCLSIQGSRYLGTALPPLQVRLEFQAICPRAGRKHVLGSVLGVHLQYDARSFSRIVRDFGGFSKCVAHVFSVEEHVFEELSESRLTLQCNHDLKLSVKCTSSKCKLAHAIWSIASIQHTVLHPLVVKDTFPSYHSTIISLD